MKVFFDPRQRGHDPKNFMAAGVIKPSPEQPARIDALLHGIQSLGLTTSAPDDCGIGPIAAIHSAEYLCFLQTIHERWQALKGAAAEVIPNIHPMDRTAHYPSSPVGQAGYHQADTACPIGAKTWNSAYWSAQSALNAAKAVLAGERHAYALCRPPGHHAFGDLAGGFCFLNNAAIAAECLIRAGKRPAILDVDVHHGNGTQGIFYHRADVLTVSIHADPDGFYPFFWGHAHERGAAAGLGANLNIPLSRGSDDDRYRDALTEALERIQAFGADCIVVALGLDAHINDPFQGLAISTKGFANISETISTTGLPLTLVQEGGYLSEDLGQNLSAFLEPLV